MAGTKCFNHDLAGLMEPGNTNPMGTLLKGQFHDACMIHCAVGYSTIMVASSSTFGKQRV
ncbi:MAG: hypothetical protein WKF97_19665 [Chitinophagaceae bacterium]